MSKYLEQLKKFSGNDKLIHATPQFKRAIDYIQKLEDRLWDIWYEEALRWGAVPEDAKAYATNRLEVV
ncbi:MAG: hypothetical protein KUG64_10880 [Cycloclasticus sp.]|nr:hypothetical protein [Cycloclasticus sp.]